MFKKSPHIYYGFVYKTVPKREGMCTNAVHKKASKK